MNSTVRPIFNEKVEFVGPINSARVHCSREKSQNLPLGKKKKERKRANKKTQTRNMDPNPT